MANSILNQLTQVQQSNPSNNSLMQQVAQFRQMHPGDPRQQVMMALNSGKISQQQLEQAVQQAQQMIGINGNRR